MIFLMVLFCNMLKMCGVIFIVVLILYNSWIMCILFFGLLNRIVLYDKYFIVLLYGLGFLVYISVFIWFKLFIV